MKNNQSHICLIWLLVVVLVAVGLPARAANISKANNTALLNNTTSWVGGVVPGSSSIAQWDNTVTAANSVGLGAPTTWGGILVSNPAAAVTITNDGNSLTIGSSGIDLSWTNNNMTLQCPLVVSASQTWAVTNSKSLTITNGVTESGSGWTLTKAGNGTVTVGGAFNYNDNLTVNAGVFNINGAFINNLGTLTANGGTLNINGAFVDAPTLTMTSGTINFATNTVTLTNNTISGTGGTLGATGGGTVILQPASGQTWNIGGISAATNSTLVFNGDATTTINLNFPNASTGMGASSGLFNIVNGTIVSTAGRGWKDNIFFQNGNLSFTSGADRFSLSTTNQTFTMTNGTITIPSTAANGFRLGSDNAASQTGNTTFTGTQSGGTINMLKGGISVSMSIGGLTTNAAIASYTLSGGFLNVIGAGSDGCLMIGACLIGGNSTAFNLFGGKLLVSGANSGVNTSIFGSQGYTNGVTSPQQIFYWTNGTLVCGSFQPTNLLSAPSGGVYGTLVNNGSGTLAPGDQGTPGKTTVYGSFSNATTLGTLTIDIGGATKATAFQNSGAFYDTVDVKSTAFVRGALIVNLTNGFTPSSSDTYTILSAGANGLNASFNNLDVNNRIPVTGVPGASFLVSTNSTSVTLSLYGTLAANFTVSSLTPPANSPITFTDTSTGSITNRHWNLGDGTSFDTNGTSFAYTYATSGSKTVVLTVTATDGSTNSYTNTVVVSATALNWKGDGTANLWNATALNWLSGSTSVAYSDAADLVINDSGSNSPAINLSITALPKTLTFNNSAKNFTLSGSGKISGTNALTKIGSGTLTILNTNDYSGGTTITGGALQLGDGTALGSIAGNIVDNSSLVLAQPSGTITVTNAVSGSGTVTVNGSGVVTLLGANTYTSNTIISAGTLKLDATSPLPSGIGKGDVVINGTLDIANVNPTIDAISGSGIITTTDTGFNTLTVGANNGTTTFSGSINNGSGTVALNTTGTGALHLTGSSSFTGDVQLLNGSAVWISANSALGSGPKTIWITNASSQLHLNGTNGNISLPANYKLLTSRSTAPGPLVNEAGNNTINGSLQLSYGSGGSMITINAGTLTLAGGVSVSDAVANDNRILELSGSGNGIISGAMTNNGKVNGTLNVKKSGAGTWTLSNANNDYGYTAVTAGRILVTGAINSSSGVVGSGGSLGGTGSIANAVTVTNVAVEGGDHLNLVYGTLALGSDLNLKTGATASLRLGTTAAGFNDKITVAGNLLVNNTNSVVISGSTLETANDYVLLTVAGTITGAFNTNVTWSGTPPTGSTNYSIVTTASQVKLHYTSPTPLPAQITFNTTGNSLVLNWPNGQGWTLQAQTNNSATGLGTNWVTIVGATSPFTNTVNSANDSVFYRLVYP